MTPKPDAAMKRPFWIRAFLMLLTVASLLGIVLALLGAAALLRDGSAHGRILALAGVSMAWSAAAAFFCIRSLADHLLSHRRNR